MGHRPFTHSAILPLTLLTDRTATLIPSVTTTPRELENPARRSVPSVDAHNARTLRRDVSLCPEKPIPGPELLIIDEIDRWQTAALEMVRG